ncbi:hypothetical protein SAMN05216554_2494 [Herbiconiux ginsengi]|uniref:Uncharacterized protein n=1 Tax=Herbiconiux ginsengi TaxID=381665 RepID=A0A1H3QHB0_9MICO|nr:hypothetical protein SAMN05216554_2494 [Herbiconiux ginsengi]
MLKMPSTMSLMMAQTRLRGFFVCTQDAPRIV